jgi:hypothetical protein
VNKERNVWIYKHHLFRRDSPEDLRLVRRRTCPGLDGRKQRFARLGVGKQEGREKATNIKSDEESLCGRSTSSGASVLYESGASSTDNEIKEHDDDYEGYETTSPAMLLASLCESTETFTRYSPSLPVTISSDTLQSESQAMATEQVDTSMIDTDAVSFSDESPEPMECLVPNTLSRAEKTKQSNIVSEVAMKLDLYAKKAMYVRGGYRTRRNGVCAVVTPPSSLNGSRGLITYDDESFYEGDDYGLGTTMCPMSKESKCITKDSIDTKNSLISGYPNLVTTTIPVADRKTVDAIVQHILLSQVEKTFDATLAIANVAGFCMSVLPDHDLDVRGKILHFTTSCEPVAAEFRLYRIALHPMQRLDNKPSTMMACDNYSDLAATCRNDSHVAFQSVHNVGVNQSEVVREFSVFAVNCLHKVLNKCLNVDALSNKQVPPTTMLNLADRAVLQRTAEIWQKSVAVNCHGARNFK